MEKLEDVKKLVEMLQTEPICIDEVMKSPPTGIKELLQQLKDDYFNYKCIIRGQEPRLRLLDSIKTGTAHSVTEAQSEAAKVKQTRDRLNERTEALKTSLTEYAEQLPGLRESLRAAVAQLDTAMEEANQQAAHFYERKEELRSEIERDIKEKELAISVCEDRLRDLDCQIQDAERQLGSMSC